MNASHPPIIRGKRYDHASLFVPKNLLREARRQKNIPEGQIPSICILDPDGDIVKNLVATGRVKVNPYWACYHTFYTTLNMKAQDQMGAARAF